MKSGKGKQPQKEVKKYLFQTGLKWAEEKKSKLEWKSGEGKKRWNKLKTEGRKNEKREIFNAIKENMKDGLKGKFFRIKLTDSVVTAET